MGKDPRESASFDSRVIINITSRSLIGTPLDAGNRDDAAPVLPSTDGSMGGPFYYQSPDGYSTV